MREGNLADIALGLPLQESGYGLSELEPKYTALGDLKYSGSEVEPGYNTRLGDLKYSGSQLEAGFLPGYPGSALDTESGLLGINFRKTYCKRVCRSLGYEKRAKLGGDKGQFLKCQSDCLIHFKDVKRKKYIIKPAEPGATVDLSAIDKETEAETGEKAPSDAQLDSLSNISPAEAAKMAAENAGQEGKSNTMLYVIIGVVVLLVVIGAIVMMRRKPAAA